MPAITMTLERRILWEANRDRVSRAAAIAAAIAAAVFGALLMLPRRPEAPPKVVQVEVREYNLQQVAATPPPRLEAQAPPNQQVNVHSIPDAAMPQGMVNEPALRRSDEAPLDPDAGRLGRARAEQATAQLASATSRIDRTLLGLDASLKGATGGPETARTRRDRVVGGGRGEGELGAYDGRAASGAGGDLAGSRVHATGVAIGALAPSGAGDTDAGASAGDDGAGAPPGVYRSNASLLAVIQRYAAGIQYCYENELRRDPALAGKLVVAITVDAAGTVTDARVVRDGVGSSKLVNCALSQIREWRFPPVAKGVTTFQTPFVFTPPN